MHDAWADEQKQLQLLQAGRRRQRGEGGADDAAAAAGGGRHGRRSGRTAAVAVVGDEDEGRRFRHGRRRLPRVAHPRTQMGRPRRCKHLQLRILLIFFYEHVKEVHFNILKEKSFNYITHSARSTYVRGEGRKASYWSFCVFCVKIFLLLLFFFAFFGCDQLFQLPTSRSSQYVVICCVLIRTRIENECCMTKKTSKKQGNLC